MGLGRCCDNGSNMGCLDYQPTTEQGTCSYGHRDHDITSPHHDYRLPPSPPSRPPRLFYHCTSAVSGYNTSNSPNRECAKAVGSCDSCLCWYATQTTVTISSLPSRHHFHDHHHHYYHDHDYDHHCDHHHDHHHHT